MATLLVVIVSGGLTSSIPAQSRSERANGSSARSHVREGSDVLSAARSRVQARSPVATRSAIRDLGGGRSLQASMARRDGYSYVMGRGTHTEAHTYFGYRPVGELSDRRLVPIRTGSTLGTSAVSYVPPTNHERDAGRPMFDRRVDTPDDADSNAVRRSSYEVQAEAAALAGDFESARLLYVHAILAGPSDANLQLSYALAYLSLEEYGIAASIVRRSLAMAPELMDLPPDLRTSDPNRARLAEEIGQLEAHLAGSSADADAWFLLGYLRHAGRNRVAAVEALEQAVALDPDEIVAALLQDAAMRAYLHTVDAATPAGPPSTRE